MSKNKFEDRKKRIYGIICHKNYVPMKFKDMCVLLGVKKSQKAELQLILDALVDEGKIFISKKGKIKKLEEADFKAEKKHKSNDKEDKSKKKSKYLEEETLEGIYTAHPKGFGFVTVEGYDEDFFIPGKYTNHAFHKDTVRIAILPESEGKRTEAEVVEIVDHEITTIVGKYEKSKNFGFVICDEERITEDIFIPKGWDMKAKSGQKVFCKITKYGGHKSKPEGVITEILGFENEPGTDILSVIKGSGIPTEFPDKVLTQAKTVSKPVSEADMAGRMDLRDVVMVTIDGEDSKDLDDAVSLTKEGKNYILGVHIADVANYVQESSALDVEALKRGTSVYLADRVIPMLPVELSNGICSLNQGEDRLAMSCIMTIDSKGNIIDHVIAESVINVNRRMTYSAVKRILVDKDSLLKKEYKELVPMFKNMEKVSALLRKNRVKRGSIDFDFPESHLVLDEYGHVIGIEPYEISVANKIIEDFMLAANETVAEEFFNKKIPFLYRVHGKPDEDKIHSLATYIQNFGLTLKTGKEGVSPKNIQKLINDVKDTKEEPLVTKLTLRSMQHAAYSEECTGHFGLAATYYTHFTSPIRRYPDLQIHRIMKDCIRGRMNDKKAGHYEEILHSIAQKTSECERRAEEAERDVLKMKKAEFMEEHVGECYDGVISGVTGWGMYVELPNTIEGLVHITDLDDDYYEYVEETYELVGKSKNKHYRLADEVRVKVIGADKHTGNVDFKLV